MLPGGKTAPISTLQPGDKVTARDTATGKDQTETVTAVEVNHDTDLYNLRVKTPHGTQVIHTTASHLFYDPSLNQWVNANKLSKSEHLLAADGTVATADGGTTPKRHDGWMWDLTVPGNNDHDFYVLSQSTSGHKDNVVARGTPVLVHNVGERPVNGMPHGTAGEESEMGEMIKEGYTSIVPQVRFINSNGDVFVADFVAKDPSGAWQAVEVKTGAGAEVTSNQAVGYPELQNSGAILDTSRLGQFGFNKGATLKMPVRVALWGCPVCGSTP